MATKTLNIDIKNHVFSKHNGGICTTLRLWVVVDVLESSLVHSHVDNGWDVCHHFVHWMDKQWVVLPEARYSSEIEESHWEILTDAEKNWLSDEIVKRLKGN